MDPIKMFFNSLSSSEYDDDQTIHITILGAKQSGKTILLQKQIQNNESKSLPFKKKNTESFSIFFSPKQMVNKLLFLQELTL
jgi:predicted AAA+ superfamily ATPase